MRKYGLSFISRGLRFCLFRGSEVGRCIRLIIVVAFLLFLMIRAIAVGCAGWQKTEENRGIFIDWENPELQSDNEELDELSITPNKTWMKIRQYLLRNGLQHGVSKAVLFSYMRGGSTLFSHIFNIDPQTTLLWYEALDGFHAHYSGLPVYSNTLRLHYNKNLTRRPMDREKILAMSDYLAQLLTCDADRLPIETLTHRFIINSTALVGLAQCMWSYIPLVFAARQSPMSIVRYMEYGREFENLPHLKIVGYTNLSRFFLRSDLDDVASVDPVDVFRRYFSQVEDSDLKTTVYGSCGAMWDSRPSETNHGVRSAVPLVGYELVDETMMQNNEGEQRYSRTQCQEIMSAFMRFLNVTLFMRSVDRNTRNCRDVLKSACKNKELIVAEIHRASMLDLEPLIQRMPDVHVVFYARDPRATAVSRADPDTRQTYLHDETLWSATDEARLLCRKMWSDLKAKKLLERRYPGSILTVRYEDFILNPRGTAARTYGQLLRKVPEGFDQWVNETMNAIAGNGLYGIKRSNSKGHISNWRSKVNFLIGQAMTQHCLKVLKELGYES